MSKSKAGRKDQEAEAEEARARSEEQVKEAEAQILEQSKRIEFFVVEYTIELLAQKMDRKEFVIPAYQREDVWEPSRKSRFIESLLMGLPIPFLFFWEQPTGHLEIVDGAQRLRTVHQFLLGGFKVGKLSILPAMEGLTFNDLPTSRQLKVKNRPIRGIILNEHADEDARSELFDRVNTGSKIANPTEIRRGALIGPFQDLIEDLAKDETLISLAPLPEKEVRERGREELVTRFFAYGDGLDDYKEDPSRFLYDYVEKMNAEFGKNKKLAGDYKKRFRSVMAFVEKTFPYGFRRGKNGKATPRTRFESIAIGSWLALKEKPSLAKEKPEVIGWLESEEYREIIGADGANVRKRLLNRLHFVRDRLLGA